jgi:serine/threonine-protein kinase PRP4
VEDADADGKTSKEADIAEPVVLQEEHDPEKVIAERKRKREEIMARFRNAPKEVKPVVPAERTDMAGSESVTTAGTRTGMHSSESCGGLG